jgi:hypothetical protein
MDANLLSASRFLSCNGRLMLNTSSLPSHGLVATLRQQNQPWMRVVWLLLAINLLLGAGLIGLVLSRKGEGGMFSTLPRTTPMQDDLATLPGFARRGNVLVGEMQGSHGASVRLVFDAKSQKLIGMKVLDAPSPPIRQGETPLQDARAPANER